MSPTSNWYIYIVQCADQSLYTGITTDLLRRIEEHNSSPNGARYTRARRPVRLVYFEHSESRSTASQREHALKRLSPTDKRQLVCDAAHDCQQLLQDLYPDDTLLSPLEGWK
jgi:putative endonuclease